MFFSPTSITLSTPEISIKLTGSFTGTLAQPRGTVTGFTIKGPVALGSPVLGDTTGLDLSVRAMASVIWNLDVEGLQNRLWGGDGFDALYGGRGRDLINLGEGSDFADGGSGGDGILGDKGNDTIFGNTGNDFMEGEEGNDRLDGGDGRDTVIGGAGDDTVLGGAGNDELLGLAGRDILTGGSGADRFIFTSIGQSSVAARDIVTDYSQAEGDVIDLRDIDAKSGTPEFNDVFRLATGGFQEGKAGRYTAEVTTVDAAPGLLLLLETNGDAVAEGAVFLVGVTSLSDVTIIA